jgi:hypothetical protein
MRMRAGFPPLIVMTGGVSGVVDAVLLLLDVEDALLEDGGGGEELLH